MTQEYRYCVLQNDHTHFGTGWYVCPDGSVVLQDAKYYVRNQLHGPARTMRFFGTFCVTEYAPGHGKFDPETKKAGVEPAP